MTVDEIVAVIRAGMCRSDKVAECSTCQRKLRAIEAVRAMGAVCEAAREHGGCDERCETMKPYRGCTCGSADLRIAIDALDAVGADDDEV